MHHFRDQLAALVAAVHVHVHAAHHVAACFTLGTQFIQAHDARRGTGTAGFHALAYPHFFLRQQLVGLGVDDGFLRQLFFLLQQVGGKVARVAHQLATVQLHDSGGHVVQEGPVVGDGDDGTLEVHQQAFEPFDGVQIQVVGGFVEQQHIGLRHQRLGQRHALFGTARQGTHHGVGVQVQALQGFIHPLFPVPAVQGLDLALHRIQIAVAQAILFNQANHPFQSCADSYKNRSISVELRLLCHIRNARTALHLQGAVIGFFHPAQNFEHGRLAGAVAANQPHTFLGFEGEVSVVEQRDVPKSQLGVKKGNKCHRIPV